MTRKKGPQPYWYPAHDQKLATSDEPITKGFPHRVEIPDPVESYSSPASVSMAQLRLLTWLGEQNLVDQVDYEVRYNRADVTIIYCFKDPNKAMFFKLAWA